MANITVKVDGAQKAGNVYDMPPEAITMTEQNLGRKFDHDEDAIMEMVNSFRDRGQDTPIRARKNGKDLILTYGRRRLLAALKHNELYPKSKMLISVVVDDDNEENAFDKAVDENLIRKNVSVVDLAFNMKTYRDKYKWKDSDIAKRFNTSPTKVSHCKKLTTLREPILKMVHKGELSFETAIMLADYNDVTQDEILKWSEAYLEEQKKVYEERLEQQMKEKGEIDNSLPPAEANGEGKPAKKAKKPSPAKPPAPNKNKAVTESIRKKQAEAAGGNGKKEKGEKVKIKPPTFVELKQAIDEEFMKIQKCPEPLYTLYAILREYMKGDITRDAWAKDSKVESRKYEMVD